MMAALVVGVPMFRLTEHIERLFRSRRASKLIRAPADRAGEAMSADPALIWA